MKRLDFFKAIPLIPIVVLSGTKPKVSIETKISDTFDPKNYTVHRITAEDVRDIFLNHEKRLNDLETK